MRGTRPRLTRRHVRNPRALLEPILAMHDRVRDAYLAIAQAEPERFLVVDATLPTVDIATAISKRVAPLL